MALDFHPHLSTFDRTNALYLAHAADIAYHRSPVRAARERLGLETYAFLNRVTRTRGFLGACDTHAILAFRGSDPVTLQTWLTDAVVKLVTHDEYEGRVHHGFSSALKRTWAKVERVLEVVGDRPLFLAGHSMGGALAVLTACRLAKLGIPPRAIYTYGSPRVGDRAFCTSYDLPTYRIVNRLDLIPEMPLASLKRLLPDQPLLTSTRILGKLKRIARTVPCYGHVKTLVYIDLDGELSINTDVEPWHAYAVARAIATRGKSFLEGITDHLISNYIRNLEQSTSKRPGRARRKSPRRDEE